MQGRRLVLLFFTLQQLALVACVFPVEVQKEAIHDIHLLPPQRSPQDSGRIYGDGRRGGDGRHGGSGGDGGGGGDIQFYFYGEANAGFVIRSLEGRGASGGNGASGGDGGSSQLSDGAGEDGFDGPNREAGYDGRPGRIFPSPLSRKLILQQFASLVVKAEHLSEK